MFPKLDKVEAYLAPRCDFPAGGRQALRRTKRGATETLKILVDEARFARCLIRTACSPARGVRRIHELNAVQRTYGRPSRKDREGASSREEDTGEKGCEESREEARQEEPNNWIWHSRWLSEALPKCDSAEGAACSSKD